MVRFGLKRLIFSITMIAIALAFAVNILVTSGSARIVDIDVKQDTNGEIVGRLAWKYVKGVAEREVLFTCDISRVRAKELLAIQTGDVLSFHFRDVSLPFAKKQDPHRQFMSQALGLREEQVIGYVMMDSVTKIVVDGSK